MGSVGKRRELYGTVGQVDVDVHLDGKKGEKSWEKLNLQIFKEMGRLAEM